LVCFISLFVKSDYFIFFWIRGILIKTHYNFTKKIKRNVKITYNIFQVAESSHSSRDSEPLENARSRNQSTTKHRCQRQTLMKPQDPTPVTDAPWTLNKHRALADIGFEGKQDLSSSNPTAGSPLPLPPSPGKQQKKNHPFTQKEDKLIPPKPEEAPETPK
jgi:hypothetical protein